MLQNLSFQNKDCTILVDTIQIVSEFVEQVGKNVTAPIYKKKYYVHLGLIFSDL